MLSLASATQTHKLIHCTDPKTWDGDIWCGNSDYDLTPERVTLTVDSN